MFIVFMFNVFFLSLCVSVWIVAIAVSSSSLMLSSAVSYQLILASTFFISKNSPFDFF